MTKVLYLLLFRSVLHFSDAIEITKTMLRSLVVTETRGLDSKRTQASQTDTATSKWTRSTSQAPGGGSAFAARLLTAIIWLQWMDSLVTNWDVQTSDLLPRNVLQAIKNLLQ